MNSYENMVSSINKLYYDKTTNVPAGTEVYDNMLGLKWDNSLAIQRVYEISALLGRNPDVVGKEKGQSAIWYNPKTKIGQGHYHRFEIHDQAYQRSKPSGHADFLFVWLRMKLKPEKAADISKITRSVFYYEPAQLVCATCHFIEATIATFSVLKDYNNCKVSLEEAQHTFGVRVKELADEYKKGGPTPLRDILERYIVEDMPSDDIFQGRELFTKQTSRDKVRDTGYNRTTPLIPVAMPSPRRSPRQSPMAQSQTSRELSLQKLSILSNYDESPKYDQYETPEMTTEEVQAIIEQKAIEELTRDRSRLASENISNTIADNTVYKSEFVTNTYPTSPKITTPKKPDPIVTKKTQQETMDMSSFLPIPRSVKTIVDKIERLPSIPLSSSTRSKTIKIATPSSPVRPEKVSPKKVTKGPRTLPHVKLDDVPPSPKRSIYDLIQSNKPHTTSVLKSSNAPRPFLPNL